MASKKMFGGLGFMVDGHMAVAAASSGALMVRTDPADCEAWADGEAVDPMEMRGRPMAGWLLVDSAAVAAACAAHDAWRGHTRTTDMVDGRGAELAIFDEPRS